MAIEDVIIDRDQTPNRANTMENSYCRLNPISCGPVTTDVDTGYYKAAEAEEWCNTSNAPWMIA